MSARKDLLATCFGFASILGYLRWRDRPSRFPLPLGSIALELCALLAKVSALPVPLVLLLLELARGRSLRERSLWIALGPFFALAIFFGIIALGGKAENVEALPIFVTLSLWARGVLGALTTIVWPWPLSILYPYRGTIDLLEPELLLSSLACLGIVVSALRLWRWEPLLGAGSLGFLLSFLPMLGSFVRGGEVYLFADRYLYFPFLSLLIAVMSALRRFALPPTPRRAAAALAVVVLVVLGVLMSLRLPDWRENEAIYLATIRFAPDLAVAHYNLGLVYDREGRADEAVASYERAVELDPTATDVLNAYGHLLLRLGEIDRAVSMLERAVAENPSNFRAYANLGRAYGAQGRYWEGIEAFRRSIELDPYKTDGDLAEVEALIRDTEAKLRAGE